MESDINVFKLLLKEGKLLKELNAYISNSLKYSLIVMLEFFYLMEIPIINCIIHKCPTREHLMMAKMSTWKLMPS